MRFWDSSAIIPLLVAEKSTPDVIALAVGDREIVVWWATQTECVSAIARVERESSLDAAGTTLAIERLDRLVSAWQEVQPVERIRRTANRLLRTHGLRAGRRLPAQCRDQRFRGATLLAPTRDS